MLDDVLNFVQMTATYSNAVLVAILPHFTDVAQKLDLPIHTPIEQSEIRQYFCDPRAGEIGGWVTLTNGYRFWFDKGHVNMFQSPRSYFNLQNPSSIPKFYGTLRMNRAEALAFARQSLRKLGYTNELFYSDEVGIKPEVQLAGIDAGHVASNTVPYYRIKWHDPDLHHIFFDDLAEVEVNADAKRIEWVSLNNKKFWLPNPDVGVVPELRPKKKPQPETQYVGGIHTTPFSPAYSNAFVKIALSQINSFVKTLNLTTNLPITLSQCANIDGGFIRGEPSVQIILDNDDRFLFEHGHVSLYAAHDNYAWGVLGGQRAVDKADLYGTNVTSKEEVVQIVRDAIHRLGYADKLPEIKKEPDSIYSDNPRNSRAKYFTCYQVGWENVNISGVEGFKISAEVDSTTKTLKILSLDNTNLWRELPKIDVSSEKPATQ